MDLLPAYTSATGYITGDITLQSPCHVTLTNHHHDHNSFDGRTDNHKDQHGAASTKSQLFFRFCSSQEREMKKNGQRNHLISQIPDMNVISTTFSFDSNWDPWTWCVFVVDVICCCCPVSHVVVAVVFLKESQKMRNDRFWFTAPKSRRPADKETIPMSGSMQFITRMHSQSIHIRRVLQELINPKTPQL